MKFKKLEIQNFLSYKDTTLNLTDRGLVLIEGRKNGVVTFSNGTGKTNLFEAIIWCLFGRTVKGLLSNDVVRNYEDNCMVSLEVDNWQIFRYRKHKKFKNELYLLIDGKDRSGGSEKETQEKIEKLLAMNFDSFINSVFLSSEDQKAIKSFTSSNDKERKIILEHLLGNERYQEVFEKIIAPHLKQAKEQTKELEDKLTLCIFERTGIENRLKGFIERHNNFEKDRDNKIAELKAKLNISNISFDYTPEELQSAISGYEENIKSLTEETKLIPKLDQEILIATSQLSKFETRIEQIENEISKCRRQLSSPITSLVDEKCPTCGKIITEGDVKEYKKHLNLEIESREKALTTIRVKPLRAELREKKEAKSRLTDHHSTIVKSQNEITKLNHLLSEYQKKLVQEQTKKEEMKKQIIELSKQTSPYADLVAQEDEKLKVAVGKESETLTVVSQIKDEIPYLEMLENMFSRTGNDELPSIPSLRLDSVIPELTSGTNYRLHKVNPDLTVDFDPTSTTQRGKVTDKFSVKVYNENGAEVYEGNSQGERKLIDICIMLTLGQIASGRNKNKIPFLFLDGLSDKLDENNSEKVMDLLREESATKESIFVTTLDPTLSSMFNNRIICNKIGRISHLVEDGNFTKELHLSGEHGSVTDSSTEERTTRTRSRRQTKGSN